MAKKFNDLRKKMTPDRRVRIDAKKHAILAEVRLQDLRRARSMSQATLADAMEVGQSEVSKIERRTDTYISTLRSYLEAMGGELHIVASFSDGEKIEITQFEKVGSPVEA